MILYLVRHANAVPVGGAVQRDADRPLSPAGEDDAALMGKTLASIEAHGGLILTSPLVRAVRTGEIFRQSLGPSVVARTSDNLAPGFRHTSLVEELSAERSLPMVVAVGHQPDLSDFISFLIADSTHAAVAMAACALACVTFESDDLRGGATLRWLLTPEIVRAVHPSF
jgi:phosphohistidine phosphatase